MAERSFVKDFWAESAGKALMWGPAIAGTMVLGPAGGVLGLAASVRKVGEDDEHRGTGGKDREAARRAG
jgi:hypothetical protein